MSQTRVADQHVELNPTTAAPSLTVAATAAPPAILRDSRASAFLAGAAKFCFFVMIVGQWAFLYYIVGFYGVASTFQGNLEAWSRNRMVHGAYVPGDTVGNLAFASHVLLAAIIAFGGTLQLVPQIRARWIAFHRWNGRVFLATAMCTSIAGLYLVWIRTFNVSVGNIAITIDGLLIIAFGIMAWRLARSRDASRHRRWALRAFLVTNAVWFMRVGFMAWILVNQGPVAIQTFADVWAFGAYLLPLAILELYLRAKDRGTPREKIAVAGTIAGLTLLMAAGAIGFFVGFWLPLL